VNCCFGWFAAVHCSCRLIPDPEPQIPDMHFQFEIAQQAQPATAEPRPGDPAATTLELMKQMLDVQREQLNLARAMAAAHDAQARWRQVLARWTDDFQRLPEACKHVLPTLEKAYFDMIAELTSRLRDGDESIENEFALAEFLDRYGVRLGQLGTLLSVVGPLAEVAAAAENKS